MAYHRRKRLIAALVVIDAYEVGQHNDPTMRVVLIGVGLFDGMTR